MDIVRKQCEVHYYRGIGIISLPQLQLHRTNIERTLNKKKLHYYGGVIFT